MGSTVLLLVLGAIIVVMMKFRHMTVPELLLGTVFGGLLFTQTQLAGPLLSVTGNVGAFMVRIAG